MIFRPFGGLLTDPDPSQVPSGSADIALNVTVHEGKLAKRYGFAEWEDNVTGAASVIFLDVAYYAVGTTWVIAKLSDGRLYRRQSTASSFTSFRGGHHPSNVGWSFMWCNRWFYVDTSNTTRAIQSGASFTVKDGGFTTPAFKGDEGVNLCAAAANGGIEGWVYPYAKLRNSVTREESNHTDAGLTVGTDVPVETRVSGVTGALAVGTPSAIATSGGSSDIDQIVFYRDIANSSYIGVGAGFSEPNYVAYEDLVFPSNAASAGLTQPDDCLPRDKRMTNSSGPAPLGAVGCFNGVYGIYGMVASNYGKVYFSIPGFPAMVPRRETYGTNTVIEPRPWVGESPIGCKGPVTAIVHGGGVTALFSPTETWLMGAMGDGKLYGRQRDGHRGCVGNGAAVGTPWAVHAMGSRAWMKVSGDGLEDIAENRFRTTLEEIPVAQQSKTRMAYYSHLDQVWASVVKTGATVAQRILVWDRQAGTTNRNGEPMGALTVYEPANLAVDEGITSMCEYRTGTSEPVMLIGTSAGRILSYPCTTSGHEYQDYNANKTWSSYGAQWRGYYGAEQIGSPQHLEGMDIHCGSNVAGNVTCKVAAKRTGQDSPTAKSHPLLVDNQIIPNDSIVFDRQDARLWQVEFVSADSVDDGWDIPGLTFKTKRK